MLQPRNRRHVGGKIESLSAEAYRSSFMKAGTQLDSLLKPEYTRFFIVRVEEMIRLMKLPVPPARVPTHTLIYLTEGEAVLTVGSETVTLLPHECLVVPAGQVFSFANVDQNRGFLCNFSDDFLVGKVGSRELLSDFEFLQVWGNPQIRLESVVSEAVNNLLKRMLAEYTAVGIANPTLISAYMLALLCEINVVYKPPVVNANRQAITLTNRFKDLLFSQIRTYHRVTDYAAQLNITPNHLNKVVRQVTDKSPTHWIDEALVLEAKVWLCQTDLSVGSIAVQLGIFDTSYFSRLFKKYVGVTPGQFRQMIETS